VILRLKVNKQLDGKANGIIESCQEIISELCSIQERGDCTWRVSDCWRNLGKHIGRNGHKILPSCRPHIRCYFYTL